MDSRDDGLTTSQIFSPLLLYCTVALLVIPYAGVYSDDVLSDQATCQLSVGIVIGPTNLTSIQDIERINIFGSLDLVNDSGPHNGTEDANIDFHLVYPIEDAFSKVWTNDAALNISGWFVNESAAARIDVGVEMILIEDDAANDTGQMETKTTSNTSLRNLRIMLETSEGVQIAHLDELGVYCYAFDFSISE
jgi:hypothetical protein